MEKTVDNNKATVRGIITAADFETEHLINNRKHYRLVMNVRRLSMTEDVLNVYVPIDEPKNKLKVGNTIQVFGRWITYNEGKKVRSLLLVNDFVCYGGNSKETIGHDNNVKLKGTICIKRRFRTTEHLKRKVLDIVLAVNTEHETSYIPCILWGVFAEHVNENVPIGTELEIDGKMQSRNYNVRTDNEICETRTTYEVSVNEMTII